MQLILDKWQEEILNTEGNIALRSGRQVGKSTIIAIKAGEFAIKNAGKSIMVISATERQAYQLFSKIFAYIYDNYKKDIRKGKDRPTKSEIKLTNGSIIRCLPTGLDGTGIRGYTVHLLIADEAAFIPADVWPAVTPMLSTTGGSIILLSTPRGKVGYFYERFSDDNFAKFHINTELVAESRIEPQRTYMLENLKQEQRRMSPLQYSQEYLGEFIGGIGQFFDDDMIKRAMKSKRLPINANSTYYLGVDVARMGGDESTFEVVENRGGKCYHRENITSTYTLLTDTIKQIRLLNEQYKFKKIYIDTGGLGAGVFDSLLDLEDTKRKVVSINNASRPVEYNVWKKSQQKVKLMKELLYMNLLKLLEAQELELLEDEEVFFSLKSVQFEVQTEGDRAGDIKIYGNYTHIAEGLVRAVWSSKEKNLSMRIDYI